MNKIHHFIDGKTSDRPIERTADVFNPATGEVSGKVTLASPADVDAAVASAKAALPAWRDASLAKRSRTLFAFRERPSRAELLGLALLGLSIAMVLNGGR